MKSCNGCKYLLKFTLSDHCTHDDPEIVYETNLYTGRRNRVWTGYFRPSTQEMRAENGNCGPDARLYSPTLFRKLLLWITGGEKNASR